MKLNYKHFPGNGPSVLIIHGVFGSLDNLATASKGIADAGFDVYTLDQRNHGRSPHDDRFDYESMAADLYEFIQDHQLQKPALVGHSMGGKTVMQYAMEYPGTFSKIVVVDIGVKWYPPHHESILNGLNALPVHEIESRQQADELFSAYEPIPAVRLFLLKNLYRTETDGFAWRLNLPVITAQIENVGAAIEPRRTVEEPALFVKGATSGYIKDQDWDEIQQSFPAAQLVTIPKAGHWVHAEQPKAFVQEVLAFLNS
ncbi:alpha/beta fold hydrolase [Arundinibacter roseus]|uniref:Alpha/beta fold hydrolase n=1 Tax=Arundinibacter roseus TaxID=2070510 RepID=A0A4R4K1J7_9BACT|nr:alpha/beta fold hydrolase [Arundinibacter roseus]TDB61187.1 alpha/beta fold hydrolase [Arundinibacter roseus]